MLFKIIAFIFLHFSFLCLSFNYCYYNINYFYTYTTIHNFLLLQNHIVCQLLREKKTTQFTLKHIGTLYGIHFLELFINIFSHIFNS